jgi:hypothetical protein
LYYTLAYFYGQDLKIGASHDLLLNRELSKWTDKNSTLTLENDGTVVIAFIKSKAGISGTLKLTPSVVFKGKSIGLLDAKSIKIPFGSDAGFTIACASSTHKFASFHNLPYSEGATLDSNFAPMTCR